MIAGRTEVAAKVAAKLGMDQRTAMRTVSTVLDAQMRTLAEHGELNMRGFGLFRVKEIAESRARNPATGGTVVVPPHKRVRFRAGKVFREIVAGRR